MVHVSELSHEHVDKPEDVVSVGDKVNVKVKSVEQDSERISLSIKDTLPSPFESIKGEIHADSIIEGRVVRLTDFGAFVEIAAGVQGLVHISEISRKHIGTPSEVLEPNQEVTVKVLSIDEESERISLSIKAAVPEEEVLQIDDDESRDYIENSDDDDNPTLGEMFGDKLKNLKF